MPEAAIREPDEIRQDCAFKVRQVGTNRSFRAILACLLSERDVPNPKLPRSNRSLRYERYPHAGVAGHTTRVSGRSTFMPPFGNVDHNDEESYVLHSQCRLPKTILI